MFYLVQKEYLKILSENFKNVNESDIIFPLNNNNNYVISLHLDIKINLNKNPP